MLPDGSLKSYSRASDPDVFEGVAVGLGCLGPISQITVELTPRFNVVQVRKRLFLRHLYIQCIILPRQARDKHRENSKKVPFSRRRFAFNLSRSLFLFQKRKHSNPSKFQDVDPRGNVSHLNVHTDGLQLVDHLVNRLGHLPWHATPRANLHTQRLERQRCGTRVAPPQRRLADCHRETQPNGSSK